MAETEIVTIPSVGRNGRSVLAAPDLVKAFAEGKRVRTKLNGVTFDVTVNWWVGGAMTFYPIRSGEDIDAGD